MTKTVIAVIVGSLRKESYNRSLASAITKLPAGEGIDFRFVEIGDMPLYNQDQDTDQPAPVLKFRDEVAAADGLMFVSPEYNRSIPGPLKNAIDHGSRPFGKSVWQGKPAGILGVSPGKAGTALMQQHLRNVLSSLNVEVLPMPEAYVQWTGELIGPDGQIGESSNNFLNRWLEGFLSHVARYREG